MAATQISLPGLPILLQDAYTSPEAASLLQDTIDFERASSNGFGINLGEAYGGITVALVSRDLPAFNVESMGVNSKITLRIQVIGLAPYMRQVPAIRSNRTADPISLGKLAITIAQEMQKYIATSGPIHYGGRTLELHNMVLTKLYHVSRGSWQPEIKVYFV
ncbi:hypothetical protein C8T65DRAFT_735129 [Cerioporus squamosus]|nr:hypothetical protein C8T65DRAFT_735129 [Cerioporus squamosus]